MSRVVSVTPLAVERDSRTFKQAASMARLGHESVVVEAEPSDLDPAALPFELISVRAAETGADDGHGAVAPPHPAPPVAPGAPARIGAALPAPLAHGLRKLIGLVQKLIEPPVALAGNLRWNLRTLRELPDAALYILHSYNQFPAVYLKSRRARAPYVYDAHDSYWEEDPSLDALFRNRLTRRMFERFEKSCAHRASEVMTVSDGVAGLLEARFGHRPLVLRNAGDLRLDRPSPSDVRTAADVGPDVFLLVMPGNAKPGDTIDEALEALAMLPDRIHLALVGDGHEGFEAMARERGIPDRIHLLPPVPPTEVASFIATADAAPILYRAWTVNFLHALPNRFFHAVAAGLPILYPPLVEITALCEEYELGVPIDPTDPESVAAGVRLLSENPELLAGLRGNVERTRSVLSWENEERVLAGVVGSELDGGGGG